MMRSILITVAALASMTPTATSAIPILYETTFTATTGPSGTGSFSFDATAGIITGFSWDFGQGIVGGVDNIHYDDTIVFGDTIGRFVFEILSETDVHDGADCVNFFCSVTTPLTGVGPGDATSFTIRYSEEVGQSDYRFFTTPDFPGEGIIQIALAVPEPTTVALLVLGLFGLRCARSRAVA